MSTPVRPETLLFLPGAGGDERFWRPLAGLLSCPLPRLFFGWPGFGELPADPAVRGIEDLTAMVCARLERPAALIAQSMGGVVALRAALARPRQVTHLVLTATSGGMDMRGLGAQDWRPEFLAAHPGLPAWFSDYREDLSPRLAEVKAPTLLLWGQADPISPPAVGRRLAALLPRASLRVIAGGTHDLAVERADQVALLIDQHLAAEG